MPGPGIVPKVPTVVRDDPSDVREGGERAASEHGLNVHGEKHPEGANASIEGREPYPSDGSEQKSKGPSGLSSLELSGLRSPDSLRGEFPPFHPSERITGRRACRMCKQAVCRNRTTCQLWWRQQEEMEHAEYLQQHAAWEKARQVATMMGSPSPSTTTHFKVTFATPASTEHKERAAKFESELGSELHEEYSAEESVAAQLRYQLNMAEASAAADAGGNEVEVLRQELNLHAATRLQLEEQLSRSESATGRVQVIYRQLEESNQNLLSTSKRQEQQNVRLTGSLSEAWKTNRTLQGSLRAAQSERNIAESEIASLRGERDVLGEQVATQVGVNHRLFEAVEEMESAAETGSSEQLLAEVQASQGRLHEEYAALQGELQGELRDSRQLREANVTLQEALDAHAAKRWEEVVGGLQTRNEALLAENTRLEVKVKAQEDRVEELEEQLSSADRRIDELNGSVVLLEEALDRRGTANDQLQKRLGELATELADEKGSRKADQVRLRTMESDYEEVQASLTNGEQGWKDKVAELSSALEEARIELEEARGDVKPTMSSSDSESDVSSVADLAANPTAEVPTSPENPTQSRPNTPPHFPGFQSPGQQGGGMPYQSVFGPGPMMQWGQVAPMPFYGQAPIARLLGLGTDKVEFSKSNAPQLKKLVPDKDPAKNVLVWVHWGRAARTAAAQRHPILGAPSVQLAIDQAEEEHKAYLAANESVRETLTPKYELLGGIRPVPVAMASHQHAEQVGVLYTQIEEALVAACDDDAIKYAQKRSEVRNATLGISSGNYAVDALFDMRKTLLPMSKAATESYEKRLALVELVSPDDFIVWLADEEAYISVMKSMKILRGNENFLKLLGRLQGSFRSGFTSGFYHDHKQWLNEKVDGVKVNIPDTVFVSETYYWRFFAHVRETSAANPKPRQPKKEKTEEKKDNKKKEDQSAVAAAGIGEVTKKSEKKNDKKDEKSTPEEPKKSIMRIGPFKHGANPDTIKRWVQNQFRCTAVKFRGPFAKEGNSGPCYVEIEGGRTKLNAVVKQVKEAASKFDGETITASVDLGPREKRGPSGGSKGGGAPPATTPN